MQGGESGGRTAASPCALPFLQIERCDANCPQCWKLWIHDTLPHLPLTTVAKLSDDQYLVSGSGSRGNKFTEPMRSSVE